MSKARDILLPGVFRRGDVDLLDNKNGGIDIIGPGLVRQELLSKHEIEDGSYKAKFNPRLIKLLGEDK